MSRLPLISGKESITALKKVGFYIKRRESSHVILRRDNPFAQVVVPDHKEIDRGLRGPSSGRLGFLSVSL